MSRRTIYLGALLYIVGVIFSVSLFAVSTVNAAEPSPGFVPLLDVKGTALDGLYKEGIAIEANFGDTLNDYINTIFLAAITIGGVLAILRIAWGGFLYITTDLWSSKEKAKEILRETVLGLCLLLAVWLILAQINPKILSLDFNFKLLPSQPEYQTQQELRFGKRYTRADTILSGSYCYTTPRNDFRCKQTREECVAARNEFDREAGIHMGTGACQLYPPEAGVLIGSYTDILQGLGGRSSTYCRHMTPGADAYKCYSGINPCFDALSTPGNGVCYEITNNFTVSSVGQVGGQLTRNDIVTHNSFQGQVPQEGGAPPVPIVGSVLQFSTPTDDASRFLVMGARSRFESKCAEAVGFRFVDDPESIGESPDLQGTHLWCIKPNQAP